MAALTQRVRDIYSGAAGDIWNEEDEWPTAEQLSIIVPAIRSIFKGGGVPEWLWDARNLDKYETPSQIARQLFEHGVRA